MDVSLSKLQEMAKGREVWRAAAHGVTKRRTRLSDWTTINIHTHTFKGTHTNIVTQFYTQTYLNLLPNIYPQTFIHASTCTYSVTHIYTHEPSHMLMYLCMLIHTHVIKALIHLHMYSNVLHLTRIHIHNTYTHTFTHPLGVP